MLRFKFLTIAILLIPLNSQGLGECSKLKVENFKLRVQIAQLTATLNDRENRLRSIELTVEQQKLVEELRDELKADKDSKFNWDTFKFEKPTSTGGK